MAVMSLKDALNAVLQDIEAMSVEELRAIHEKHRDGDIALAMQELRAYVGSDLCFHEYPLDNVDAISIPNADAVAFRSSLAAMNEWEGENESCFALAA